MKLRELAFFTNQVEAVSDFYERLLNIKPHFVVRGSPSFRTATLRF